MKPEPFFIKSNNSIRILDSNGRWGEKKVENISEKELLFRQVMLTQSIRSMMIFFVWIAIINIVGIIAIFSKLLG